MNALSQTGHLMPFGYVPRSKTQELADLYEKLLRIHPFREKYPQTWLMLNARIGDLRGELGLKPFPR